MSTRTRTSAIAALVGCAVCAGVVAVSALAAPVWITSMPNPTPAEQPRATDAPDVQTPPSDPIDLPAASDGGVGDGTLGVVGLILVVLMCIAVVLAIARAARILASRQAPEPIDGVIVQSTVDVGQVQDVLRHAQERIMTDDDPNIAVIRCWESLEALGASAGVPRSESETASEYVIGILAAMDVPRAPAEQLARLYGRALFSSERLDARAVDDARECVTRIATAISATRAGSA
ncbi:DUF4129 domain-containing protein [Microbacterium sp. bgisy189]|uniref:DUF4129 domain-containing protein n=1 Tax=Microbacterium sp. bgisy189 TaxID=3413798 RepID=UPI003EBAA706